MTLDKEESTIYLYISKLIYIYIYLKIRVGINMISDEISTKYYRFCIICIGHKLTSHGSDFFRFFNSIEVFCEAVCLKTFDR